MKNRVRELRKSLGLSQKDFAESINLSQNHISSIEQGVRKLTIRTIEDICEKYHANPEWLLNGTGEMFKDELEEFNIQDEEIKEFIKLFLNLDDETKEYIKGLMYKTIKK